MPSSGDGNQGMNSQNLNQNLYNNSLNSMNSNLNLNDYANVHSPSQDSDGGLVLPGAVTTGAPGSDQAGWREPDQSAIDAMLRSWIAVRD